ncbi:hypothetical protein AABM17_1991 [Neisseria musculi]|uniref:Uncharacterized protein n=2 Tax=Neisseria musculi TaxID=1815583 RepID=A0A7H1MCK7_9NEIS|nr:hypothetical protein H7A79_0503 [Neisseria musculi]QNT60262.1 hypothetical protein H7A79_1989 [Neisseria musculi]
MAEMAEGIGAAGMVKSGLGVWGRFGRTCEPETGLLRGGFMLSKKFFMPSEMVSDGMNAVSGQ